MRAALLPMIRQFRSQGPFALTLCFALLSAACGGGGGGGGSNSGSSIPRKQGSLFIPSEPVWTGAATDPVQPWVDGNYLPNLTAITADQDFVYAAATNQIARINKETRTVESLIGYTPNLYVPTNLVQNSGRLYFRGGDSACSPCRISQAPGELPVISTLVPQSALGNAGQHTQIFASEHAVYWVGTGSADGMSHVFMKSLDHAAPPETILSIPGLVAFFGSYPNLVAVRQGSDPGPAAVFYRVNLEDRTAVETADPSLIAYANHANARNAEAVYWIDGTSIMTAPGSGGTSSTFATGLTAPKQILADETYLYVLEQGEDYTTTVRQYSIVDKVLKFTVPLGTLAWASTLYQGDLLWGTDRSLNRVSQDGTNTVLYDGDTRFADVFLPLNAVAGIAFYGNALAYNLDTGELNTNPMVVGGKRAANSTTLFALDDSEWGIASIPAGIEFSAAEMISTDMGFSEMSTSGGYIYASRSFGPSRSQHAISRIPVEGGDWTDLFNGESKGLWIDNGTLYFLCKDACGRGSWTLVSLPVDGGTVTIARDLGSMFLDLTVHNGTAYVAEVTDDYEGLMRVYAINLSSNAVAPLIQNLSMANVGNPLIGSAKLSAAADRLYLDGWFHPDVTDLPGYITTEFKILSWDQLSDPIAVYLLESSVEFNDEGTWYYWLSSNGLMRMDLTPTP